MGMKIFNHLPTNIKILSNRTELFKPVPYWFTIWYWYESFTLGCSAKEFSFNPLLKRKIFTNLDTTWCYQWDIQQLGMWLVRFLQPQLISHPWHGYMVPLQQRL
jgi:hypothetical protein